jgi:GrpB-like predicted nucleotidyltransferase (UPF0157 family)
MEHVYFLPYEQVRESAEAAFDRHRAALSLLLPFAQIEHIGGTTLPGVRTKGDLDIQVRVDAAHFDEADRLLSTKFERNEGSTRTSTFSSFKDDNLPVPLGIQLSVIGSEYDDFLRGRELLLASPELAAEYDALKARFESKSMDEYREAKSAFFERILR